jgi:hypothetical protein
VPHSFQHSVFGLMYQIDVIYHSGLPSWEMQTYIIFSRDICQTLRKSLCVTRSLNDEVPHVIVSTKKRAGRLRDITHCSCGSWYKFLLLVLPM